MVSSQQPFQVRELLRHLPDLLAGSEPEVEKPEVRRMLLHDPVARAAVTSIAMLTDTSAGGSSEVAQFARQVDRSILRSVERGTQIFADVMSKMLLSSGLGHLQSATSHETYFSGLPRSDSVVYDIEEYEGVAEALVESLGIKPDGQIELVVELAARTRPSRQADSLSNSKLLLEAAANLVPADPTVEYYLIQAATYEKPHSSLRLWRDYSKLIHANEVIGRGLHESGRAHLALGNYASALRFVMEAELYLPRSVQVAYNGMVSSMCAHNWKMATHFADQFVSLLVDDVRTLTGFVTAINGHAKQWRYIRDNTRSRLDTVLRILPSPLVRGLEEVTS